MGTNCRFQPGDPGDLVRVGGEWVGGARSGEGSLSECGLGVFSQESFSV